MSTLLYLFVSFFFFQAEDGIRDAQESRGLGDVYKRQSPRVSSGNSWERPLRRERYPEDAMAAVKQIFVDRGAFSGRSMARVIRNFDNGDGLIDQHEFAAGMQRYLGFPLKQEDVELIFSRFDKNGDGSIEVGEFLGQLRGNVTTRRMEAIEAAFSKLDADQSGEIGIAEIQAAFDVRMHPQVLDGSLSRAEALDGFLRAWDADGDQKVSRAEFLEYFKDVSIGMADDQSFFHTMAHLMPSIFPSALPTPYGTAADVDPGCGTPELTGAVPKVPMPRSNHSFSSKTSTPHVLPLQVPIGRSVPWGQGAMERPHSSGVPRISHGDAGQCIQRPELSFARAGPDPVAARGHPYRSMMPVTPWMDGQDSSLLREREIAQQRQLDHRCGAHASPNSDSHRMNQYLKPVDHPAPPPHFRRAKAGCEAPAPILVPEPCILSPEQRRNPHSSPAQGYMANVDSSLCRRRNWGQADSVGSLMAWP
eukprot:TRINITY_DN8850_c0_g1_i1.p1 TRINITY_DN8850_c0_g1~~TRINITY_DN8850_c0_g1_i1.p1  ORF type:complete len:477 (+),score=96.60 TRINITY_DN8850_c0_g1_i1:70-1500(+)